MPAIILWVKWIGISFPSRLLFALRLLRVFVSSCEIFGNFLVLICDNLLINHGNALVSSSVERIQLPLLGLMPICGKIIYCCVFSVFFFLVFLNFLSVFASSYEISNRCLVYRISGNNEIPLWKRFNCLF